MADQELNNFENSDSMENVLRSLEPEPLAVDSGKVMFEAGRAVGREQAFAESQTRVRRSLTLWRLATAASLAIALYSLVGQLTPPTNSMEAIVDRDIEQPGNITSSQESNANPSSNNQSIPLAYSTSPSWNINATTQPGTVIGVRNQLLRSALDPNVELLLPSEKLVFEPPKTALELQQQYINSEEL